MNTADTAPGNRASLPGWGHGKIATGFPDGRQPALAAARSSRGNQGRVALCCAEGEGQRPVLGLSVPPEPVAPGQTLPAGSVILSSVVYKMNARSTAFS